ncbi:hypothetical protein SLA2020_494860 [Shorea laevis]
MGGNEGTSNGGRVECSEQVLNFKRELVNNGIGCDILHDFDDGGSGTRDGFRTYKRRRQLRSSFESKVQEDGRASVGAACQSTEQRQWRNVVLEHMYHSLSDEEGGIQCCIRDALAFHPEFSFTKLVKESNIYNADRQKCFSHTGQIPNGTQHTAEVMEGARSNGSLKELSKRSVTEMCQRVFFNIIISEKFTSLCKLLFDNFQGIKEDRIFHLSLINSRMKEGVYENSPMLFLTDIQQVWRKLQDIGTEIISLTKGLSDLSRVCYSEQIGCSAHDIVEEEKHEFYTRESESHAKLEQTEACGAYKVSTCRHCGETADGRDCLVCDACEGMYHVACIKPAIKEIPPKSWYCSSCIGDTMVSAHENCVVCERLNAPIILDNHVADKNDMRNGETLNELEEDSNCIMDDGFQSSTEESRLCKICKCEVEKGEYRICEHNFCENKYYHARCLTSKQLQAYGPRWYCPSCLCGACLVDKDDDKIVLCDGCDHAYHLYCMTPPRDSIPEGKWFCSRCEAGLERIRKAKRAYQILENKRKSKGREGKMAYEDLERESDKVRGGMDMLLNAANTLNYEEKLAAAQTKS